ncbi:uncharacterized protein LOC143277833 isoform X2 [Babylonia areolata]|uniref:uncharacterized protein LOC143277833 isoform X2 n=1 Tax=Babylonia areolata TaxID=304850 RepID=UPI003FD32631
MLSLIQCCSVLLLLAMSTSAPLDKADTPRTVKEVEKQEEELQSLLQLADEKSARNDVTVHEEHVQHVHEVNGHKVEVDTARKTVSDTKTGEVLSDVKQEVSKADDSAGAPQPEVEVKTEVDVPAEGVHETIVQSGKEAEEPSEEDLEEEEEEEEEMAFSPEAVADYLYRTGDFNRFYSALAQLVNTSTMTEEEAESYSQLVAMEYDRMQMQDYENSILVQRRDPSPLPQYPVGMETGSLYPLGQEEEGYAVPMETPEALFDLGDEPSAKDLDLDFDPYELLYALWNEAYGTGDARAEALVSELFDKVRGDNDPDDEAQVRDILLDLIANSLAEDDQPPQQAFYGWQPINDADTAPFQPMENAAPVQPMAETEDEQAASELMAESEKRSAEEPTVSKDTKPQQPAAEGAGQVASAQPMGAGETKGEEPQTAEKSNDVAEQPASAPVSATKRAAETV